MHAIVLACDFVCRHEYACTCMCVRLKACFSYSSTCLRVCKWKCGCESVHVSDFACVFASKCAYMRVCVWPFVPARLRDLMHGNVRASVHFPCVQVCMLASVHTCKCARVRVYVQASVRACVQMFIQASVRACKGECVQVFMCACECACVRVSVQASVRACKCACIRLCMRASVCECACAYTRVCVFVCGCVVRSYACVCLHACTYMHICVYACVYKCVCACVRVRVPWIAEKLYSSRKRNSGKNLNPKLFKVENIEKNESNLTKKSW